jgi:hypothetical protein
MTTLVRAIVKPDQAERNRELIRAVYAELEATQPRGIHYATFELDDGVTFLHLYSEDEEHEGGLGALPSFQHYLEGTGDRFAEPPIVSELHAIGGYRVFDAHDVAQP